MDISSLTKTWPLIVLTATPFLAAGLKQLAPVWEKRLGENYVFVVMFIGTVLNLIGFVIKPEDLLHTSITADAIGASLAAVEGAGLAFGSSKLYDLKKGKKDCAALPTKASAKRPTRRRKAASKPTGKTP